MATSSGSRIAKAGGRIRARAISGSRGSTRSMSSGTAGRSVTPGRRSLIQLQVAERMGLHLAEPGADPRVHHGRVVDRGVDVLAEVATRTKCSAQAAYRSLTRSGSMSAASALPSMGLQQARPQIGSVAGMPAR